MKKNLSVKKLRLPCLSFLFWILEMRQTGMSVLPKKCRGDPGGRPFYAGNPIPALTKRGKGNS